MAPVEMLTHIIGGRDAWDINADSTIKHTTLKPGAEVHLNHSLNLKVKVLSGDTVTVEGPGHPRETLTAHAIDSASLREGLTHDPPRPGETEIEIVYADNTDRESEEDDRYKSHL